MSTFQQITFNDYHDKKLGRPPGKFDNYMLCDCNPHSESEDLACTDESGCINRMTQIECSSSKCRWGKLCRNQRFHRRQYVKVDIIQTEKKLFNAATDQLLATVEQAVFCRGDGGFSKVSGGGDEAGRGRRL